MPYMGGVCPRCVERLNSLLLLHIWHSHSTEAFYCIACILLMTMTMEAEFSPEMLINTYQSTRAIMTQKTVWILTVVSINSCQCFLVHGQDDSTVKPRTVRFANEVSDTQCIVADEIIQWAVTWQNQISSSYCWQWAAVKSVFNWNLELVSVGQCCCCCYWDCRGCIVVSFVLRHVCSYCCSSCC